MPSVARRQAAAGRQGAPPITRGVQRKFPDSKRGAGTGFSGGERRRRASNDREDDDHEDGILELPAERRRQVVAGGKRQTIERRGSPGREELQGPALRR